MGTGKKVLLFAGILLVMGLVSGPLIVGIGLGALLGKSCVSSPVGITVSAGGEAARTYLDQFSKPEQARKQELVDLIVDIGLERQFSLHSIAIAVATAIQESDITNYGNLGTRNDRDSLGIYQQRPSMGWGSAGQLTEPSYAINAFYDRLEEVTDRDERPMIDVAMQIQRPNRQAYLSRWEWDTIATELVANSADTGTVATCQHEGWRNPLDPGYTLTSGYGMRMHPIHGIPLMHRGLDFAGVPEGTPVYAAQSGQVEYADWLGSYGNFVRIAHGDNTLTTYAHLDAFSPITTKGAQVQAGEVIGYVGTTGGSTGVHLHFEILVDGQHRDPMEFMEQAGVQLAPQP